jgi:ADP-ribose pyrophosphatase
MVHEWKTKKQKQISDHHIFKVRQDTSLRPWDQEPQNFVVLECPSWANMIPITPQNQIVFVRQFRHGIKEISLEIPGGVVDSQDREPESAARRELEEETGYCAREWIALGKCRPNSAFQNNFCYHYLALGAELQAHTKAPDENEELEVVLMSFKEVSQAIESGEINHALVLSAFYALERWMRKTGFSLDEIKAPPPPPPSPSQASTAKESRQKMPKKAKKPKN